MPTAPVRPDLAAARPHSPDEQRLLIYGTCFLILLLFLFFTRLGARALWSSEFRWAEIAREMLVT
ncbi:hypothetical protein, partial [Candidatus Binatus sp.]|uniref:hypothetical protein n=1 Tax=Candidatus Binatus sp. TaxID=2811406 RepID=UPI003CC51D77